MVSMHPGMVLNDELSAMESTNALTKKWYSGIPPKGSSSENNTLGLPSYRGNLHVLVVSTAMLGNVTHLTNSLS